VPLIRAKDAETKLAQAEVMRFQDVEADAQRMLAEARRQAEAILAEARAQGERLKAEAHKSALEIGRAEGLKIGQESGRKQAYAQAIADFAARHASVAKALVAALEQFETRRRSLQSEMERDVIGLAGAIAHRVTKLAVDVDPSCVAGNLREALQLVARRNRLEIRLHPADLEQAREFARDLLPAQEFEAVVFLADESVGRAGVLLRTAGGQVDATIDTQWVRILDEILAGWQEHWLLSPALLAPTLAIDEADPQFVEFVQDGPADPPATAPQAEWPEPSAAARQALIDQAIGEAMMVSMNRTGTPGAKTIAAEMSQADDAAVVEEIDPAEVEQIDLNKIEEIDPNDVAE
jgi:flagellar assembly protein FliH